MGLKHFLLYTAPKKILSYLPPRLRAKMKHRIASWMGEDAQLLEALTTPVYSYAEDKNSFDVAEAHRIIKTLGFPAYSPNYSSPVGQQTLKTDARPFELFDINFKNRSGTVLVTMCTLNYLHYARTMIASVREHHSPEELAIHLMIVDWDGQEPVEVEHATVFSARNIGVDRFDYMALKFNAMELSCACKPHFLHYVMAQTQYKKIVFIDADIYIFGRLDHLLDSLNEFNMVVTPHTSAPPPMRDGSQVRPRLKEIMYAGSYNSGIIGMNVVPQNAEFVRRWSEILTAPAAFLNDQELENIEQEQQLFNWLVSLASNVKVLKDTAYNVAYWNLHDRSLRYTGWDDENNPDPSWRVDGLPLVAFHFSGFSLRNMRRLSRHDFRYDLYFLPSVTKLVEFYAQQLIKNGGLETQELQYRFNRFRSGLEITPEMRMIYKKHELFLWSDVNPWDDAGEHYYVQRLFLPVAQTASLLPVALYYIYQNRGDLQAAFPHAHIEPESMIRWFIRAGLTEQVALYQCYDLHRPVVPKLNRAYTLQKILRRYEASFPVLRQPMSQGRSQFVAGLREMRQGKLFDQVQSLEFEYFAISPVYLIRKFVQQNPKIARSFPDLLFADAPAFAEWFRKNAENHFLDPKLADIFLQKAQGHALARIFSFLNEDQGLAVHWPLALVGQNKAECMIALLSQVQYDRQFDLDDIIMFAWLMETRPWAGLPLTFELLANARRQPSPLLPEGQEALLGPLLSKPGFREALAAYRNQMRDKKAEEVSIRSQIGASSEKGGQLNPAGDPGVNFFGYFKSPIGLGSLSKGLALALGTAGVPVQKTVLNIASMEKDLRPDDFIRTYDHTLNTNLFVSYPHLPYRLLETYPNHVVKGRNNIVYLAWEQRDGYPTWVEDYAAFDQIWALSDFAAGSFRRYMKRDDVVAVPGVVDFASFPAAASKSEAGLDPDYFTFLYVFDAHSSIERKNPEAAIKAFIQAFSPKEKVQLLLKVNNSHRLDCRPRLQRLQNLASRSGMNIRFLMANLPRNKVLNVISAADCYVSLHRAEGFGYTCAEAMAYGKPVIATNYSGTTEFMDTKSAFLVDYQECEVNEADGPFQRGSIWAEPSVEHAAAQMRQVYLYQQAAKEIGEAGSLKVRQLLSAERVGLIAAEALSRLSKNSANPR